MLAIRGILQRQLDETRARLGIPGAQVTIIFRDGSSWTGSSGMADVGDGVEVGPGTAFALASVSKTYTAALVLALAADGRIDLDAS
ncbi:MAG TPA: serine hydrolase, partial [Candidatus Limnocylindrales bacterium]|nr:serine hydrolase [Candidatus Limnocylindrales bacterium]